MVQAQAKVTIQPVVEEKGAEKHAEVQATEDQVMNYQMNFRKKAFFDEQPGSAPLTSTWTWLHSR